MKTQINKKGRTKWSACAYLLLDGYWNLAMTLFTSESSFLQTSPGFLPQYPQVAPSLFKNGLCDAQVPLNCPSLMKMSRTDISTKNMAMNAIVIKTVVIFEIYISAKLAIYLLNNIFHLQVSHFVDI